MAPGFFESKPYRLYCLYLVVCIPFLVWSGVFLSQVLDIASKDSTTCTKELKLSYQQRQEQPSKYVEYTYEEFYQGVFPKDPKSESKEQGLLQGNYYDEYTFYGDTQNTDDALWPEVNDYKDITTEFPSEAEIDIPDTPMDVHNPKAGYEFQELDNDQFNPHKNSNEHVELEVDEYANDEEGPVYTDEYSLFEDYLDKDIFYSTVSPDLEDTLYVPPPNDYANEDLGEYFDETFYHAHETEYVPNYDKDYSEELGLEDDPSMLEAHVDEYELDHANEYVIDYANDYDVQSVTNSTYNDGALNLTEVIGALFYDNDENEYANDDANYGPNEDYSVEYALDTPPSDMDYMADAVEPYWEEALQTPPRDEYANEYENKNSIDTHAEYEYQNGGDGVGVSEPLVEEMSNIEYDVYANDYANEEYLDGEISNPDYGDVLYWGDVERTTTPKVPGETYNNYETTDNTEYADDYTNEYVNEDYLDEEMSNPDYDDWNYGGIERIKPTTKVPGETYNYYEEPSEYYSDKTEYADDYTDEYVNKDYLDGEMSNMDYGDALYWGETVRTTTPKQVEVASPNETDNAYEVPYDYNPESAQYADALYWGDIIRAPSPDAEKPSTKYPDANGNKPPSSGIYEDSYDYVPESEEALHENVTAQTQAQVYCIETAESNRKARKELVISSIGLVVCGIVTLLAIIAIKRGNKGYSVQTGNFTSQHSLFKGGNKKVCTMIANLSADDLQKEFKEKQSRPLRSIESVGSFAAFSNNLFGFLPNASIVNMELDSSTEYDVEIASVHAKTRLESTTKAVLLEV